LGREPAESQASIRLTKPAALRVEHKLEAFSSDRPQLDDWLKKRALAANEAGTARTFVVCRGPANVVGYISLCAGSVQHDGAPGSLRRNAPDPIPVIILARLAVSVDEQGSGLGKALLADAMKRAAKASAIIGARALVVHALDDKAARFYERHGFSKLRGETYFVAMKTIVGGL
jgi:predicted N-acetyltransferase YhbS